MRLHALAESAADYRGDAALFRYLVSDLRKKLVPRKALPAALAPLSESIEKQVGVLEREVASFARSAGRVSSAEDLRTLAERKRHIGASLHAMFGMVGHFSVSGNWQSPAIDQSEIDMAGQHRGKIIAHYNDYTRDQHREGTWFEHRYASSYLPVGKFTRTYAYVTASGMAAVLTAALLVLGETDPFSPVLIGSSCYFETKQLLRGLFRERLHEEDLSGDIAGVVRSVRPVAVFLDTIGNEPAMRVVSPKAVIREMRRVREYRKKYIVIDTSASAFMLPVSDTVFTPKGIMVIGVESLNKLLQLGLDRVTAGVVWGTGFEAMKLYDYRDHGGTMCPDSSVASIPSPDRVTATRHIRRLERNARFLATYVRSRCIESGKPVRIVYPDGPGFSGAYFMMYWERATRRSFDGFIRRALARAKRGRVPLVHGTSFGFQTTRLYTVAMHSAYERAFLRVSPGTETLQELEKLGQIIVSSLP